MNQDKPTGDVSVASDGLPTGKLYGRPRARLFTFLSGLWILVSAPALLIVLHDSERWIRPTTVSGKLVAIAFEQWIGIVLILLHLVFVALAVRFHLTEQPREEVFPDDDPDTDHKLD